MEYIKLLNELSDVINTPRKKETAENFKKCIITLKEEFGKEVSIKFLKDLCNIEGFRFRSKRISYLMARAGLKTERHYRHYKNWKLSQGKKDVIEYAIDKQGKVYIKSSREISVGELSCRGDIEVCFMVKV